MPEQADERLIYRRELLAIVGLSYPTVWRRMQEGTFPRSVRVGHRVAWYRSEIDDWLSSLERQRFKADLTVPADGPGPG